jgi:hypothetical protein
MRKTRVASSSMRHLRKTPMYSSSFPGLGDVRICSHSTIWGLPGNNHTFSTVVATHCAGTFRLRTSPTNRAADAPERTPTR